MIVFGVVVYLLVHLERVLTGGHARSEVSVVVHNYRNYGTMPG